MVIGCSTAPSATPTPLATTRPVANASPAPSALPTELPSPEASSSAVPATVPPASGPPATPNPNIQGSFALLPSSPRADFDIHIECSGSIGQTDPVAIVGLKGANGFTLRDYADVAHPRTACAFGSGDWSIVQLIDPRHIVIVDEEATDTFAVVDLPQVRFHWFHVPKTKGWGSQLITVGPALDRIVWKQVDPDGSRADTIYVSTANRTRVLATLPDTNVGGFCGSPSDSAPGRYTAAGDYLFVLNEPLEANSSLLIFKGRETLLSIRPPNLEWAHQANVPSRAVWSPVSPTLYWSRGGDVWRWTPGGGQQRFIAGVTWFNPTISADGRYLAYAALNADLKSHVYLVDLTGDAVPHRIGDGQRAAPQFLNSTQLWYIAGDAGGCAGGPSGYRIYDVTSGAEDASIIEYARTAWPATSANY